MRFKAATSVLTRTDLYNKRIFALPESATLARQSSLSGLALSLGRSILGCRSGFSLSLLLSSLALAQINCLPAAATTNTGSTALQAAQQRSEAYFNQACRDYRIAHYKIAEIELRQSISEDQNNAIAHYYLANTLVYLNRHEEAIEEFKRAYHLDPFGPVSRYCRSALLTYKIQPTVFDGEEEPIEATQAMKRYFYAEKNAPPQEKITAIHDEAEREKQKNKLAAELLSKAYGTTTDNEVQKIQQSARQDVADTLDLYENSPYPFMREIGAQRAENIQRDADEMVRVVKARAEQHVSEYERWSKRKGELLDEAVANLEKQLVTKSLPGTPQLVNVGTDLFVRNYAFKSRGAADLHPAVAHVDDPPANPVGERANQKQLNQTTETNAVKVVKGKLVGSEK